MMIGAGGLEAAGDGQDGGQRIAVEGGAIEAGTGRQVGPRHDGEQRGGGEGGGVLGGDHRGDPADLEQGALQAIGQARASGPPS
jgi:hypothetical protein